MRITVTETQKLMLNRVDYLLKRHLRLLNEYGPQTLNGMSPEEADELFDCMLMEDDVFMDHMKDRFKEVQE